MGLEGPLTEGMDFRQWFGHVLWFMGVWGLGYMESRGGILEKQGQAEIWK